MRGDISKSAPSGICATEPVAAADAAELIRGVKEGSVPFTLEAVGEYVLARIGQVAMCGAQDVIREFPNCGKWVSSLGLLIIFSDLPLPEHRPFALQLIRRVEMALREYETGRAALLDLVDGDRGRWSPYFRALSHFEAAVSQLYQAYDNLRKLMGANLFEKDDGSALQRLNDIYNTAKHEFAQAEQPLWITDQGLESDRTELAFTEIEEMLRECASIAETMTNSPGVRR